MGESAYVRDAPDSMHWRVPGAGGAGGAPHAPASATARNLTRPTQGSSPPSAASVTSMAHSERPMQAAATMAATPGASHSGETAKPQGGAVTRGSP